MKSDREFLAWMHQRLVHIHGENPNYDYMHKLRAIIGQMKPETATLNMNGPSVNNMEYLAGAHKHGGFVRDHKSPS